MSLASLLSFLDLPGKGAVEITTDQGRGYFDDGAKLEAAVHEASTATLTVHPFEKDVATNEVGAHVARVMPECVGAVVARFHHPADDVEQIDTSTMATRLAASLSTAVIWTVDAQDSAYLVAAVEPFEVHEHLDAGRKDWLGRMRAHAVQTFPEAVWELVDAVPLDGGTLVQSRPRAPSHQVRRYLYRAIPPKISRKLERHDSKFTKVFQSRTRSLGLTEKGQPVPTTEENYDREAARMLLRMREGFSDDDVLDTLWNRPNGTLRGLGLVAAEAFVKEVREEVDQDRARNDNAPARAQPHFGQGETLHSVLHGLYFQISETTGGWVQRYDVEISYKAEVVLQYLITQGADFYYFKGSDETVFAVEGRQYVVNTDNRAFQSWFFQHVQLFSPQETQGKALTLALRIKIQDYEYTHKPRHSTWGRYTKATETLYFCFDPDHMQVIKVQPTQGKTPRISEVVNGAENVTLRGMQMRNRRAEVVPDAIKAGGWKLFRDDLHRGQALSDGSDGGPNYRLMSTVFNLTTLLPNHRQRPIKFHVGTEGSGKTSGATDLGYVIYGGTPGAEYDDTILLAKDISEGGPFAVHDNAELKDRRKFGQLYLVASTGQPIKKRQLYTTSDERVYEPNGNIVITAIEGFHKPEELRRTFTFEFDAKHWNNSYDDLSSRLDRLETQGDLMLSAILEVFSLRVLPDFEKRLRDAIQWLKSDLVYRFLGNKKPFLDWIARMLLLTESLGDLLVDDPDSFDARQQFNLWLQATYAQDAQARVSADPNMDLLEALRNEAALVMARENIGALNLNDYGHVDVQMQNGILTIGPVTTGQLFRAFGALSRRNGIPLEAKSAQALGHRLRSLSTAAYFGEHGWQRVECGQDRTKNNRYLYKWVSPQAVQEAQEANTGFLQASDAVIQNIYE